MYSIKQWDRTFLVSYIGLWDDDGSQILKISRLILIINTYIGNVDNIFEVLLVIDYNLNMFP